MMFDCYEDIEYIMWRIAIAVVIAMLILVGYRYGYRNGQKDGLSGKWKYHLADQIPTKILIQNDSK